jgi:hypothetical protein
VIDPTDLPQEPRTGMRPSPARLHKLPFADRALTLMLFVLVVDIFLVAPLTELTAGSRHWSHIFLMSVLAISALMIWGNLWLTDMFVAGAIACVASRLAFVYFGAEEFEYAGYVLAAGTLTLLAYLLTRRVFATGRVNLHRIEGAIAIYLLAGLILSQVLLFISLNNPGAFLLLGHPASHPEIAGSMGYYSFVAITTTGFGDITPVHPLARSFTVLGAVFGTMYPAILIGRLVSQELLAGRQ